MKPWDKDIAFALKAFLAAAFVMLALRLAYPNNFDKDSAEASRLAQRIEQISPGGLRSQLLAAKGKSAVVMFYASWCPYCRTMMPEVTALLKGARQPVTPIFISIDSSPKHLAQYLTSHGYDQI